MRKTSKGVYAILVVALVLAVISTGSGLFGLLGTRCTEIDVESGRVRSQVLVFGAVVSDRETETRFSRAVVRNNLDKKPTDYRFAGSRSMGPQVLFGVRFVCGKYGQAITTVDNMMRLFELKPGLRESEREIIYELMKMLRSGDVYGMREFVNNLYTREVGSRGDGAHERPVTMTVPAQSPGSVPKRVRVPHR